MTHKEKLLKAVTENDKESVRKEMNVLFEEKLERKIWKIYKSLESNLELNYKKKDEK